MPFFLLGNAALYLLLALWCTLRPHETSSGIGFEFTHPSALSEYLTVYGGLELGLGLYFLLGWFIPSWRRPALGFGLVLYASLALYRGGTLLAIDGLGTFPKAMFAVESSMTIFAVLLLKSGAGKAR